jgi:pimeloyl-ACP methyl ester carboxylesterase
LPEGDLRPRFSAVRTRPGDRYSRAVDLDQKFAAAYSALATGYANLGDADLEEENARKAYELRDGVSEAEKLGIETWYEWGVTGDLEKTAEALESGVRTYPLRGGGVARHSIRIGGAMSELKHRFIETNGIRMHIAECGTGPLVLLCHGFPESWYSWRHQLQALAEAGFHAVAPDMRGYGQTDRPEAIDQYSLLHLVGDMVGLLDAFGADTAVIAGHDWGAPVAWYSALLRPDRFRAVIGLSVPFWPRLPVRPTSLMPQTDEAIFYQLYFQAPGVAEAELERDVRRSIRSLLYSASGDAPRRENAGSPGTAVGMVPREGSFLSHMVDPASLPFWLTDADVDVYVKEFTRTGFRGGLNWYRNIDRSWELFAAFADSRVSVPALYIAGDRDLVVAFRGMDQIIASLPYFVPQLRATLMLPGCGHWTQQERPLEVNKSMINFLQQL